MAHRVQVYNFCLIVHTDSFLMCLRPVSDKRSHGDRDDVSLRLFSAWFIPLPPEMGSTTQPWITIITHTHTNKYTYIHTPHMQTHTHIHLR